MGPHVIIRPHATLLFATRTGNNTKEKKATTFADATCRRVSVPFPRAKNWAGRREITGTVARRSRRRGGTWPIWTPIFGLSLLQSSKSSTTALPFPPSPWILHPNSSNKPPPHFPPPKSHLFVALPTSSFLLLDLVEELRGLEIVDLLCGFLFYFFQRIS